MRSRSRLRPTVGLVITTGVLLLAPLVVLGIPTSASAQEISITRDIEYAFPGGVPLLMDAYVPAGGPHPAVLLIHGGGWSSGGKGRFGDEALFLAEQGFAAFTVNYRLAPEFPFPAAVEDVRSAVEYIRRNAERLRVLADDIAALGGSAGGNLAAMLGTLGSGPLDRGSRVSAVVSWSGPMDLTLAADFSRFSGYLGPNPSVEIAARASPITYVDASDSPMYIANGTSELVPFSQAEVMAAALDEAGVPVELVPVPGNDHAEAYQDRVWESTLEFLRTHRASSTDVSGGTETGSVRPPTNPPRADAPPRSSDGAPLPIALGAIAILVVGGMIAAWLARAARKADGGSD